MKRVTLCLLLAMLLLALKPLHAQYYFYNDRYFENDLLFEVGGSAGFMNCLTDLGGKKGDGKGFIKDLNMKNTQFCGGIYGSATYKGVLGLRLEATFGQVKGYDSVLKGVALPAKNRYERNQSFRSNITELAALLEFHPIAAFRKDDAEPSRFSPYVVGGVGLFSFNPQGNLNNTWINLHPLRTEGQGFSEYPGRKVYKLRQMNIPFGVGVKYELSALLNARFEIVHRVLFTDYLDDVSKQYIDPALFAQYLSPQQAALATQLADKRGLINPGVGPAQGEIRGDSGDNDSYFSINFKIGITLGRSRR
jgi:hypothetical protein